MYSIIPITTKGQAHQDQLHDNHVHLTSIIYIFNCGDHLKTLQYSAPIDSEQTIQQHNFYACEIIGSRPRAFEKCKSAWSGMSMHTLIQEEDILSFC